ncbi:hypothetical protein FJO98_00015 [Enterococcus sp. PF-2]|uniref:helix-turn-helix domain-containing protein n=1 Tax=unclassified Enterococcus TaxID=2608891 RepID=UPI00112495B4|nr:MULTISPECIES: helix-turn-helix domain-containing protein [unclassified Enterococcus]TPE08088.1 hypothetical protein FJP08_00015 [Enterococcus sp. PF-3]TPE29179.1 hypothetical protein FJO98_00015 [Enterococcus sp. PF-2]
MVLENNIKRYLDMVIHIYYQNEHKMYKSMLRNALKISTKTLDSDIEKVNLIFNKQLIQQEDDHILLNMEMNEGLKQIYKKIIQTSTVVSYFYEVSMCHLTLSEIYNELYLSESMEYRIRRAWNKYLNEKGYDAEFTYNSETKRIDLVGDEDTIRSLMRYMLFEYLNEDIYDNLLYTEILTLIEFVLQKRNKALNYVATDLVAAALFISVVRISQGYHRERKPKASIKQLYKAIRKDAELLDRVNNVLNIEVSLEILEDLFSGRLADLMKLVGVDQKKLTLDSNKQLVSFVKAYSRQKYHNEIYLKKNEIRLLKGIYDFADYKVSSFIYSPHKLYWDWIANVSDKATFIQLLKYHDMTKVLTTDEKVAEFFFVLNNMLNFDNLEKSVKVTKILMISRYPTFYQDRIETAINDRYHEFVDLNIYKESIGKIDDDLLINYEYILSEFSIPIFSERHIYFPEILSEEFITNLDDLIFHF